MKDGPTLVPFGNLNGTPPISGMWKPRGKTIAARLNNPTEKNMEEMLILRIKLKRREKFEIDFPFLSIFSSIFSIFV